MTLRTIVLGPPGSGKSTLTQFLLQQFPGMGHFAVRLYFAAQMRVGSDLGEQARPFAEQQCWLPDELVIEAVRRELEAGRFQRGFLFEGLPGNLHQADLLQSLFTDGGIDLDALIYLQAPDEICLQRAARRRVCQSCDGGVNQARVNLLRQDLCLACGMPLAVRPDDHAEAFRKRLAVHRAMMREIQPWFNQQRTILLDALLPAERVCEEAMAQLKMGDLRR